MADDNGPQLDTPDGPALARSVFMPEASTEANSSPLAAQEANKLAKGDDLEEDGKKKEHARYQSFRSHINWALIAIFWIIAISIALGIGVYVWHILVPTRMKFLDTQEFEKLQTLLGSAVLSSALSGYVKQRME